MARQYEAMNQAAVDLWRVIPRESVINDLLTIYRPHAEAVAALFAGRHQWFSYEEFLGAVLAKQWRLALKYDPGSRAQFTTLCHNALKFACVDLLRSNLPMDSGMKARMEAKGEFVTTTSVDPQIMLALYGDMPEVDNGDGARKADEACEMTEQMLSEIDPEAAEVLRRAMEVDLNVDLLAKLLNKSSTATLAMLESAIRHARYGEPYLPSSGQ